MTDSLIDEETLTTEMDTCHISSNTDLEIAIKENDISLVYRLLETGSSIFSQRNNKCIKLCNGYYERLHQEHPRECQKNTCFKTAVYYGLVNNYLAYKTIYKNIYYLQYLETDLRFRCICCSYIPEHTEPVFLNIRESILNIVREFKKLSCECNQKYILCKGYKEDYLYFSNVYTFLKDTIIELKNNLISFYGITISSLAGFELESFNTCIHTDAVSNQLTVCNHIGGMEFENLNLTAVVTNLIIAIDYYLVNCEIMKLLFNQQAYEIFEYMLSTCTNEEGLVGVSNNLYRNKLVTDINHQNLYTKKTILELIIEEGDYCYLVKNLFNIGLESWDNNILNMALLRKYFNSGLEIYQRSSYNDKIELVNGKSIFRTVMYSDLSFEMKIKYLEEIIKSNIDIRDDDPITVALDLPYSYQFIDIMVSDSRILNTITYTHTDYAIHECKADALKLLFRYGANPNGDSYKHIPIITYFDRIMEEETMASIEVLITILDEHPNLNIKDRNGYTALHLAALYGYSMSLVKLLEAGADPFITHTETGMSALLIAIDNDNFNVVNKLVFIENEDHQLVNIVDNNGISALMYAINSHYPIKMILELKKNINLDLEYYDGMGRNILSYIIDAYQLSSDMKLALFRILIDKMNLEQINTIEKTPIIIKACLKKEFEIVKLILLKLYEQRKIIIEGEIESFQNCIMSDVVVISKYSQNCYNLVLEYIKLYYNTRSDKVIYFNKINMSTRSAIIIMLIILKYALVRIVEKKMN